MITLKPIVTFTGPYRRRSLWFEAALTILAYAALGALMAYAVVGMTGALDEVQACWECQTRIGK